MLALSFLVVAWSASGRCVACAGAVRSARPVVAFDRWHAVTVEIGRSVLNAEGHVDDAWRPDAVQRVRSS
jgi:hypothetical protein